MTVDLLAPWPVIVAFAALAAAAILARRRRGAPAGALLRAALLAAFAVLVAVDPAVPGGRSQATASAADVLFVVDATASMAAEDHADGQPRLSGVRTDIAELTRAFPGAHFSLIRFDSHAAVEVPWTTDVAAIETAVSVLRPERAVFSRGSNTTRPLDPIAQQLPRQGTAGGDRFSVLFYFADGEQTQGTDEPLTMSDRTAELVGEPLETEPVLTSFGELADRVDDGAVLGYGTTEGAPMVEFLGPATQAGGGFEQAARYVVDQATGRPAISRFDPEQLATIAEEVGLPFVHRTGPGGLTALADDIAERASTAAAGDREAPRRLYWVPASGLVAVALWQWYVSTREASDATRVLSPRRRGERGGAVGRSASGEVEPVEAA